MVTTGLRRTLGVALLSFGLVPGVTAGMLPQALGFAHCDHSCCRGEDHCVRGSGHAHPSAGDDAHRHETTSHAHHGGSLVDVYAMSSVDAPSESCRETCGVLVDGPSLRVEIQVAPTIATPRSPSTRLPALVVPASSVLARSISPRAPPLS